MSSLGLFHIYKCPCKWVNGVIIPTNGKKQMGTWVPYFSFTGVIGPYLQLFLGPLWTKSTLSFFSSAFLNPWRSKNPTAFFTTQPKNPGSQRKWISLYGQKTQHQPTKNEPNINNKTSNMKSWLPSSWGFPFSNASSHHYLLMLTFTISSQLSTP